jgi:hypothetical protein
MKAAWWRGHVSDGSDRFVRHVDKPVRDGGLGPDGCQRAEIEAEAGLDGPHRQTVTVEARRYRIDERGSNARGDELAGYRCEGCLDGDQETEANHIKYCIHVVSGPVLSAERDEWHAIEILWLQHPTTGEPVPQR